jgi:hypothetical protein
MRRGGDVNTGEKMNKSNGDLRADQEQKRRGGTDGSLLRYYLVLGLGADQTRDGKCGAGARRVGVRERIKRWPKPRYINGR